jgi:STE24 endopeptidase
MKTRQLLLGIGTGITAGYLLARSIQAFCGAKSPPAATSNDARRYGRERRALEAANVVRSIAGVLAFAYGPLAPAIERTIRRLPAWAAPGAFACIVVVAGSALELPAEFVEGHLLERRYGLTEQPQREWLVDQLKAIGLAGAVSGVLGMLGGTILRRFPRRWPLVASLGTLPLLVLANVVVPLYILPLFNRFEPLRGPLEERLRALAEKTGVGDADILRMDMSRQTKKANAFVTGIGTTHRIVLGDTLIDRFDASEIEFVVAHELGHYVSRDTWRLIGVAELFAATLFLVASRFVPANDGPTSMIRVYAFLATGAHLTRPLALAFSRSREWAADRFAVRVTHDPHGGAAAFRRLRDQNLAEEEVPLWYELLFASHPSLGRRIKALESRLVSAKYDIG